VASSSSRAEVFVAECPRDRAASSAGLQAWLVFVGAFERVAWIGGEASAGEHSISFPPQEGKSLLSLEQRRMRRNREVRANSGTR